MVDFGNLHGHQMQGMHGHWQLFGPRVVVISWDAVEIGVVVVGTGVVVVVVVVVGAGVVVVVVVVVGAGVVVVVVVVVGTGVVVVVVVDVVVVGVVVIGSSQVGQYIGHSFGVGLVGAPMQTGLNSNGWTQRCKSKSKNVIQEQFLSFAAHPPIESVGTHW